jgi:hypothetical protein
LFFFFFFLLYNEYEVCSGLLELMCDVYSILQT